MWIESDTLSSCLLRVNSACGVKVDAFEGLQTHGAAKGALVPVKALRRRPDAARPTTGV
jgi:hypothetical protein